MHITAGVNAVLDAQQSLPGTPAPSLKDGPAPPGGPPSKREPAGKQQRPTNFAGAGATGSSCQEPARHAAASPAFELAQAAARGSVSAEEALEGGGGAEAPEATGSRQVYFDVSVDGEVRRSQRGASCLASLGLHTVGPAGAPAPTTPGGT